MNKKNIRDPCESGIVRKIGFDVEMSGRQDKQREQQKREQMHRIDPRQARSEKLKVVVFGESTEFIKVVQAEDESRKQKKKVNAHISGFVKRPQKTHPRKKSYKAVSKVKEHNEDSSNGADTRKAVKHFVERSPGNRRKGGSEFSIAQNRSRKVPSFLEAIVEVQKC